MKRSKSRVLSLLLAVVMVLGLLPMGALAAEENTVSYDYTGATFKVTSTSVLPEAGTVEYTDLSESDSATYARIGELLSQMYDGVSAYQVSKFQIKGNDGNYVDLSGATIEVSNMSYVQTIPYVFVYSNGELTKLESKQTQDPEFGIIYYYGYTTDNLDCIVTLSPTGLTEKEQGGQSEFEPGTYTVTANLYVDGKDNVVLPDTTAYLTNLKLPPVAPIENNAKLIVGVDGKLTLTVKNFNTIFTLQNIDDGENVIIKERMLEYVDLGAYNSRINGLVLELENTSGSYSFTNCKEYPTILEEDKFMPIQLSVDFSSMKVGFDDSSENMTSKVFEDTATGSKVTLSTSEASLLDQISSVSLVAKELTSGADYETAKASLKDLYEESTAFTVYSFDIVDGNGNSVVLNGNTQIGYSIPLPANYWNPSVFRIVSGEAVENTFVVTAENQVAFSEGSTGIFVLVDASKGGRLHDFSYTSDEFSFSFKAAIVEGMNPAYYEGCKAEEPKITTLPNGDKEIRFCVSSQLLGGRTGFNTIGGKNRIDVSMAYEEGKYYYLVVDEGLWCDTLCLNNFSTTEISNGKISFDLYNIDTIKYIPSQDYFLGQIGEGLYYGWTQNSDISYDEPQAYILVSERKIADTPMYPHSGGTNRVLSLTYNGKEQDILQETSTYVWRGNNNVISDTMATYPNECIDKGVSSVYAKNYFKVTPADGYTWLDGSTDALEYSWYIKHVKLGYKYVDEVIRLGETPKLEMQLVEGSFVDGDDENSVKGFTKPMCSTTARNIPPC